MKRVVSFVVAMIMVFCMFSFMTTTVSAAEIGEMKANAIQLKNGQWYTKWWASGADALKCFHKIIIPSRGYITFDIEKIKGDKGWNWELMEEDWKHFHIKIYDSSGKEVWSTHTRNQTVSGAGHYTYNYLKNNYCTYKIGLKAGTYYMHLDPDLSFIYTYNPIKCRYKYTFTKSNVWEIEPNNTKGTATLLPMNTTMKGVHTEESWSIGTPMEVYDTAGCDYYKVKLVRGTAYTVYIKNYSKLYEDTTYSYILDPYGGEAKDTKGARIGSNKSGVEGDGYTKWTMKAQYSGWYYLVVKNDSHDAGVDYSVRVSGPKIAASKTTATLARTGYAYDGKVKTPAVTVKYGSKTLTKGTDYTVSYASGRKNVGQYKVVITYKGSYTGTKTLYFKIYPPKTTLSSVATSGSKALKVTWGKKSTQVTGYQIQYSTSSKFASGNKTKTISSYKTTSTTIKSLTAKKTYYVRVRTYKTVGGKTYYSSWSNVKYKKTK